MAEKWQPKPNKIYLQWVSAIMNERDPTATVWEIQFTHDIRNVLRAGRSLTQLQAKTLEKIYTERTK